MPVSKSESAFSVKGCFLQLLLLYSVGLTTYLVMQGNSAINDFHTEKAIHTVPIPTNSFVEVTASSRESGWDELNPLSIPAGKAKNLPSLRVEEPDVDRKRKFYGGAGDKKHLGGFTVFDIAGVSPAVWKHMVQKFGVHSVLDVGCGRGTSTMWFLTHGLDVLCAEGSHDAVVKTMLPDPESQIVEHDFSRGPWWPEKTYDAAWAVEFLEHVGVHYHFNYMTAFRKSALLFVTSSRYGGWHHTEVHFDDWWIMKYESYGFRYSQKLTDEVRRIASLEKNSNEIAPDGKPYNAQHIWLTMKVFINPTVAALPQHAHLFPEHGCYGGRNDGNIVHRECGTGKDGTFETPLDRSFLPKELRPEMDQAWEEVVKKNIAASQVVQ